MNEATPEGPRPLTGVRILDLTRVLAGPIGTMVLADLGADVIKVERPDGGDDLRHWGPPFTSDGESVYFLAVNRNKKSIALDVRLAAGRELFLDLARTADVVVENFRPGTIDELGIGWQTLRQVNERLILVSLSAYGSSGPYRDLPGYDIVVQAMGGLMSVTGEPNGRPMRVGIAIADVLAGLYVAIGVQAALRERDRSGVGDRVELSLLGVELASMVNVVHNQLIAGIEPRRWGNAHASMVPYDVFRTANGFIAIAVATEEQWPRFCTALGQPGVAADARFARNRDRVANRDDLAAVIEPILAAATTDVWVGRLRAADVPCGPVNSVGALLADPQVEALGMLRTIARESGPIEVVGSPLRFASGELPAEAPPSLGRDTDSVLRELGLAPGRVRSLRKAGVIR